VTADHTLQTTKDPAGEPILIWGAGAIGGTIAAYWARAGVPVLLVDVVKEHVEACRTAGLRIEGPLDNFTQRIPAVTPAELTGIYSRIVLAVKAQITASVLPELLPHLAPDGFILSAQNGLNETTIAEMAGAQRTMGCYLGFASDWLGPGQILYGGRGEVALGEIDGCTRARTVEMHRLMTLFEPNAVVTDNVWGYLWSKLCLASMLFATALNNDDMPGNFADARRYPVFNRLAREVMTVARARQVKPQPFGKFDSLAFMPDSPESASRECVALLAQRWRNSAKKHSGFWRDMAVRKRRTEIDALMGPVVALGRQAGVDTPAIRALIELVHDIENGKRVQSLETLDVLIEQCAQLETQGR
jgi:2-dehydropantoate 2-reductase